jgi:hypothetical protein
MHNFYLHSQLISVFFKCQEHISNIKYVFYFISYGLSYRESRQFKIDFRYLSVCTNTLVS